MNRKREWNNLSLDWLLFWRTPNEWNIFTKSTWIRTWKHILTSLLICDNFFCIQVANKADARNAWMTKQEVRHDGNISSHLRRNWVQWPLKSFPTEVIALREVTGDEWIDAFLQLNTSFLHYLISFIRNFQEQRLPYHGKLTGNWGCASHMKDDVNSKISRSKGGWFGHRIYQKICW